MLNMSAALLLAAAAFGAGYMLGHARLSPEAQQKKILDRECQDWRRIVGWRPDGTMDLRSPYRMWLAEQPYDYQSALASSNSAAEVLRSIRAFRARSDIRRVS